MNGTPFQNTKIGQHFLLRTMPEVAKQLKRVADALEAQNTDAMNNPSDPCSFCKGGKVMIGETTETKIFINTGESGQVRTLETECVPCPNNAECSLKNVPTRAAFLIEFCPICGRKL